MGASHLLCAAEFSAQFVDGLNRPLPGVLVEVSCEDRRKEPAREVTLLHLRSDSNGLVHSEYDAVSAGCGEFLGVSVEKEGYASYSSGPRSRYVLERRYAADEVHRVAALEGETRQQALRELLAGNLTTEISRFRDLVVYYEAELRPVLRALAGDRDVTVRARELLSLIGAPEDARMVLQLAARIDEANSFDARWRYWVVSALLSPHDDDEWSFLRKCALNDFEDRWVDAGAIQTLKLIGSPRSEEILEEVQKRNTYRAASIAKALEYVKSYPGTPAGPDLKALGARVVDVVRIGTWKGNDKPRYNQAGDKALVDMHFHSGLDALVYTATFHRMDRAWVLRGVRETLQSFAP
jgi:hypothetical protein